ncbi:hypothetical protein CK203_113241 [Vitis vinifera]|uniref:Uncharacterized protein n=1 Tax=Vitis vinifera TaxID=29760 RepID=A0A438CBY1_VITVI|nr:hypothetical protein CK203_113241 [Vitis vinifera]
MCPRVAILLNFFMLDFFIFLLAFLIGFGKGLRSSKAWILHVNELPFDFPWIIQRSPSFLDCFGGIAKKLKEGLLEPKDNHAKTGGANSSSPSIRLRAPRETLVQGSIPEPPQPLVVPPLVEDASLSPSSRCYEKRRHPPLPRQVLPEPKSQPPSEPQSSQPPAIKSQIPSGMTPETSARAQGLLPSAVEVRHPTVIHFTTDGRHGILGARHIVEALHIPYEPARPEDYRVWTHPSQSDIVHILSRGASTCQYLLRKELPLSMFFIDALLRHNIFPLQHWVQRRGVLLEALFRISRDSSLALIISLWPLFCTLKRRAIGRSSSERMLFHFSSPDCYVRFWST